MKKIIIIILSLLCLMFIFLITININKFNLYKDQDHVIYDDIFEEENPTIYYYYQSTCHFCNSIKDQISDFAELINEKEGIEIKLVDMVDYKNQEAWYDWDNHDKKYGKGTSPKLNPNYIYEEEKMKEIGDIKITGTPTMIYVKNKKVQLYKTGADVFDILETVNKEFDLGYSFNRDKYGKN